MNLQYRVPPIDEALLNVLEVTFPNRCPDPEWSEREIWQRVGEQRLIRWLRHQYKNQQEQA